MAEICHGIFIKKCIIDSLIALLLNYFCVIVLVLYYQRGSIYILALSLSYILIGSKQINVFKDDLVYKQFLRMT